MPLETATFITDLAPSNPAHTDGLSQADSHIRLIKAAVKDTFPNFTSSALQSTQAQLDAAVAGAFPLGTVALPGMYPIGNLNTGIWSPAANQLAVSLNGIQALLMGGTALVTTLGVAAAAFTTTGAYSGGTGQLVPIGGTLIWWDDVLPTEGGYVWANGVPISRTLYPILFARWGTRFGAGDGATTFGTPNLQEVAPVGKTGMGGAASPGLLSSITLALRNTLGGIFGADTNTLSTAQLPAHSHANTLNDPGHAHVVNQAAAGPQKPNSGGTAPFDNQVPVFTSTAVTGISITNVNAGSGAAHNNVAPSTACNYIIRAA